MLLEKNLRHLAARFCHVLDVSERDEEPGRVEFLAAKNGGLTCKVFTGTAGFLFHSRYDPLAEATRMVAAQLDSQEPSSRIVVYGFGCGHHIRALLELLPAEEVEVDVVETNVSLFKEILKHDDFTDLIVDDRVRFTVTDRPARLAERAAEWEAAAQAWIIHEPSLRVIPNHLDGFRLALEGFLAHLKSVIAFRPLMEDNFAANVRLGLPGIGRFISQFRHAPAILVSAGPSLARNADLLQAAKEHCLIGCVGTALGPLLQRGVEPDFFMMTDPQPKVIGQVEQAPPDMPMFFLSTVYPGVPEGYGGPRFIVYQKDYPLAEVWASKAGEPLVRTGGSVATTLFDVFVQMDCDPICLVGQDLAYTGGESHVKGAHLYTSFSDVAIFREVPSFHRDGAVKTSVNLMVYKRWLERAARESVRTCYNATEGGAFLDGFEHVTLKEFIRRYSHVDVQPHRHRFRELAST